MWFPSYNSKGKAWGKGWSIPYLTHILLLVNRNREFIKVNISQSINSTTELELEAGQGKIFGTRVIRMILYRMLSAANSVGLVALLLAVTCAAGHAVSTDNNAVEGES